MEVFESSRSEKLRCNSPECIFETSIFRNLCYIFLIVLCQITFSVRASAGGAVVPNPSKASILAAKFATWSAGDFRNKHIGSGIKHVGSDFKNIASDSVEIIWVRLISHWVHRPSEFSTKLHSHCFRFSQLALASVLADVVSKCQWDRVHARLLPQPNYQPPFFDFRNKKQHFNIPKNLQNS